MSTEAMNGTATDTKPKKKRKRATPPRSPNGLIDSLEACRLLGVLPDTWRKRVARGKAPLPHSVMGRLSYYRLADIRHRVKTGKWPKSMTFKFQADPDSDAGDDA